jgi:transcriptional regulator with XRE-family HTH domain
MRSKVGSSIREARQKAGLTQEHLGRRLGLKGRAIYRWERDETAPTGRHYRALIRELEAVNPEIATKLKGVLEAAKSGADAGTVATAVAQPVAPLPAPSQSEVFELAVLKMADELDLPASRVRRSLAKLFERMHWVPPVPLT